MADRGSAFVLDSFALLAYLGAEPGMPKIRAALEAAGAGRGAVYMSLINLGEVLYIAERERGLMHAHGAVSFLLPPCGGGLRRGVRHLAPLAPP